VNENLGEFGRRLRFPLRTATISSCGFGVQRSVSGFFFALIASSTILLIASARDGKAENAALRHQVIILRRRVRGRPRLTNDDRWFFIQMYRSFPSILKVLTIIRPETLVRWHRAGFRH
jgi:hypothetical protein